LPDAGEHERGKQAIMKSDTEKEDKKADLDFYDWFDSVESRMNPTKSMPLSIDERKIKSIS
jgi:hypothetical protein